MTCTLETDRDKNIAIRRNKFLVSASVDQRAHCFGCGCTGDVPDFVKTS
ncbi:hypothetical protein SUS17_2505 [Sphingomonas sp. S17]|nr:hypothetical protein SUS17_2505 [Sphingomonas sp. S17]